MDRLDAMQIFVSVVDRGSFSAVARERGIGQPAVSKGVSALEAELGAELLHRSSRSVTLTDSGREFYASAFRLLQDFESATARIVQGQTAPKGLLRVSAPATFARLHLVPKLAAFFADYPEITLELAASGNSAALIEDGFDLAIHSGDLPDSTLVARRFAQTTTILAATPQFLTRFGAPRSLEDLASLRAVLSVRQGAVEPWCFNAGSGHRRITPRGIFRTSDLDGLRLGVLEHLGIAQAPAWLFAAELREGTVVRLLQPLELTIPLLAVRPGGRRPSTRLRVFLDHLERTFAHPAAPKSSQTALSATRSSPDRSPRARDAARHTATSPPLSRGLPATVPEAPGAR